MKNFDYIKNTFITLTSNTHPHGHEDEFVDEMLSLDVFPHLNKDPYGNYFVKVGKSRTIFAAHLDTATKYKGKVSHVIVSKEDSVTVKTDGTTILGADDRAGITIMLYMIKHNISGLYYFFIGEEVGCVGSSIVALNDKNIVNNYDRIISFDRKETASIITHQCGTRTCSQDFAGHLSSELNKGDSGLKYKADNTGAFTDSYEFINIIPECTNISVGYYAQHTFSESQNISHLAVLAEACIKVDWENLITSRVPGTKEVVVHVQNYPKRKRRKNKYSEYSEKYSDYEREPVKWTNSTNSRHLSRKEKKRRYLADKNINENKHNKHKLHAYSLKSNKKVDVYHAFMGKVLYTDINEEEISILNKQYNKFDRKVLNAKD